MVFSAYLIGAALFSLYASAVPVPDSSVNEPAVSAPNGVVITDTTSVPSATAVAVASPPPPPSSPPPPPPPPPPPSMSTSSMSSSSTQYGSGSSSWSGSGYDSCVQQCMSSYGAPPSPYKPTTTMGSSGSTGSGATHTVIVAPTQGVLRYVPFAINASVGDTIQFMWNANNHTVTKSSALLPCNKTADAPFASGTHDKGFMFTQVVNSTDTTFFYCGTPTHCQKGMFGIINPPSAITSSGSMLNAIPSMAANSSDMSAMVAYTNQKTAGNKQAASWGNSIDVTSLPDWAHQHVAENTLYTRTFLAANPEVLASSGFIDLSATGSNPIMIPQDITVALSANNGASSTGSASSTSTATGSAVASSTPTAQGSGASQLASPSVLLAVMAVIATFFAL